MKYIACNIFIMFLLIIESITSFAANDIKSGSWVQSGTQWIYMFDEGTLAKGSTVIDGNEYYFDNNGLMEYDLVINDKYYGFNGKYLPEGCVLQTGNYKVNRCLATNGEDVITTVGTDETIRGVYYLDENSIVLGDVLTFYKEKPNNYIFYKADNFRGRINLNSSNSFYATLLLGDKGGIFEYVKVS